jgi:hypothetical protein
MILPEVSPGHAICNFKDFSIPYLSVQKHFNLGCMLPLHTGITAGGDYT